MAGESEQKKFGELAVKLIFDSAAPTEFFQTTFNWSVPSDAPAAAGVTVTKATDTTDITFDIPFKFGDDFAVPISGPAFMDTTALDGAFAEFKPSTNTNPYGCPATSTTTTLTVLESSLRVNLQQKFTGQCEADIADDTFSVWWGTFQSEFKTLIDDAANSTVTHRRLGCHTPKSSTTMTCYAGFKVPANVSEKTDVLLKVFKETETLKKINPAKAAITRKAGSMGAAPSTATCTYAFDDAAKAYKITYTNKGEDEAICIFSLKNDKAAEASEYTFSETDAIMLTKANKKETDDDTAKLALSAGYVNSSWSILTIILIVGGIVVILVVALIWWFRPAQVESEEED